MRGIGWIEGVVYEVNAAGLVLRFECRLVAKAFQIRFRV